MSAHKFGGPGSTTYPVPANAVATPDNPFVVQEFNPSLGDELDLTQTVPQMGKQAWVLLMPGRALQGHAGQALLTQAADGAYTFGGDRDGDGKVDFVVQIHAVGAQTAWVDVASHILF